MKILIILLLSLSAVFCDPNPKYVTIENALLTFNNFVTNYDEKLDQSAKFPELQAAIDAIYASMQNYDGKAKSHLPKIKSLNNEGRVKYTNCVGPVYEWCVSMNTTLNIFIKYIDEGFSVKDRRKACRLAGNLLRNGFKKTTASLLLLEEVQLKMASLDTELKDMVRDIKEDFSPNGIYGGERADMLQIVANALYTVSMTIVNSRIGDNLGLKRIFYENNLGHHINGNINKEEINNIKGKIIAIQLLFNAIQKQTNKALEITKQVKEALNTESIHLHQLKGLIEAADSNRDVLLSDNKELQRDLIPSFTNLGESCRQYAIRHGYSLEASKNISRNRRQAVNLCQEKKDIYEEILINSKTFNATGEDGQKRDIARSIAQNMQCETVYLLTANWNDPDTSTNYDI